MEMNPAINKKLTDTIKNFFIIPPSHSISMSLYGENIMRGTKSPVRPVHQSHLSHEVRPHTLFNSMSFVSYFLTFITDFLPVFFLGVSITSPTGINFSDCFKSVSRSCAASCFGSNATVSA